MPRDHAVRVVSGAAALAPNLGERMLATRLLGKPMVLRELLPHGISSWRSSNSPAAKRRGRARYLAYVVGVGACAPDGRAATGALGRCHRPPARARYIDAPTWLWDSVVDLTASHEAGYLEHCRRYALAQAA